MDGKLSRLPEHGDKAACWHGRSNMAQRSAYPRGSSELPWELRRRGLKDSLRHDQRVTEAIRKNLRELIAEEGRLSPRMGRNG